MFDLVAYATIGGLANAFVLAADLTRTACEDTKATQSRLVELDNGALLALGRDARFECVAAGQVQTRHVAVPVTEHTGALATRVHAYPGEYVPRSATDVRHDRWRDWRRARRAHRWR